MTDCANTPYDEGPFETIASLSRELMRKLIASDYYISLLQEIVRRAGLDMNNFDPNTKAESELISMWNDFWFALPDSAAILRYPFYELCDLCERMFDEDENE